MDRGPSNYSTWGIIKRRICVENVPGVKMLGRWFNGPLPVHIVITPCKQKKEFVTRDIKFAFG